MRPIKRKRALKTCNQCNKEFMARVDNPGKFCSISSQVAISHNHKVYRPGPSTDYNKAILLRNNLLKTLPCGL